MRPAIPLASAAVLIAAPRLAIAFLEADGIPIPPDWRVRLLVLTAGASAAVLTGGQAYLAHAMAASPRLRGVLATLWTLALLASGILITPAIVAGLASSPLGVVLDESWTRWAWAWAAVLSGDLMASGLVVAGSRDRVPPAERDPVLTGSGWVSLGLSTPGEPVATPSLPTVTYPCPAGCDRVFTNADSARGHLAQCPTRRAAIAAKGEA